MELDAGASIPWEVHSQRERVELLDGAELRVTIHAPRTDINGVHVLHPGDTVTIPPHAEHKIEPVEPLLPSLLLVTARPDFGSGT
jgi:quercetin dioxygenase-like cupin family protein